MKGQFIILQLVLIYTSSLSVMGTVNLAEPTSDRMKSVSVSLENTGKIAYLNEQGAFAFHNVDIGNYIVQVNDNLYSYQSIFVEVTKAEVKAYDYSYRSGKGMKHRHPFEMNPAFKIQYTDNKPSAITSIIKSPYVYMIGVPLLLFLCMKMVPQNDLRAQAEEMAKQYSSKKK